MAKKPNKYANINTNGHEWYEDYSRSIRFLSDYRKFESFDRSIDSISIEDALKKCYLVPPLDYNLDISKDQIKYEIAQLEYQDYFEYYNSKKDVLEKSSLATILCDLGIYSKRVGKYDEALECYKKAIEIDPNIGNPYNNMGRIMYLQGKYDEAVRCFVLAYINNVPNEIKNLCKHCGYAYISSLPEYMSKFKDDIEQYRRSLTGSSHVSGDNIALFNACVILGKAILEIKKREYEEFLIGE